MENIWHEIGDNCLAEASKILNAEIDLTEKAILTEEKVKTAKEMVGIVKELVDIAISIDTLNLQWEAQSQFGGQVFRGSAFRPKDTKN